MAQSSPGVLVAGEGLFGAGDSRCRCGAGDVVLVRPLAPHRYETACGSEWAFYWTHFIPPAGWMQLYEWPGTSAGVHVVRTAFPNDRLAAAFRHLLDDHLSAEPYRDELLLSDLEQIVLLTAREHRDEARDPRIAGALERMKRSVSGPLGVKDLADAAALSPSRFSHLFKAQVGDTVSRTMTAIRLRQAALLLQADRGHRAAGQRNRRGRRLRQRVLFHPEIPRVLRHAALGVPGSAPERIADSRSRSVRRPGTRRQDSEFVQLFDGSVYSNGSAKCRMLELRPGFAPRRNGELRRRPCAAATKGEIRHVRIAAATAADEGRAVALRRDRLFVDERRA